MKNDKREIERRMERFKEVCRSAGVKLTHQRMEIFRQVAAVSDHPDAEAVYRGVRRRIPTLSLDTVYRALWLFNDLGLVTTLGPPRESARFDANIHQHHHFVCRRCGRISDFFSDAFDELRLPRSLEAIGSVETTHVEVRGICCQCALEPRKKGNAHEL